ncbi:MAG: RagB/SusD family nutrient uptake outer membrane protein [Prolixibacteraceae bacterium]|nr:RagB/SusD family nutrient uptake outer membrane protein [Prolixibacteraceae bacterium]
MKKIIYIILFGLLVFSSCQDDVLDKEPLDLITDNVVWSDPALIDAYLTQLYAQTVIFTQETPGYNKGWEGAWDTSEQIGGPFYINQIADEARPGWGWVAGVAASYKAGGLQIGGGFLEWWEMSYKTIRSLNEFIERLPTSPVDESLRKVRIAEARFLRAFNYFGMVKRYGGVPLILKAQKIDDPKEELYPARDKEQVIYDFVLSEVDAIAADLPETPADYGRPSKYTALALKCRAALYAGSIAQYGTIQLNGLLGIPAGSANGYYQKSYDAAKAIITSGKFALYNADADKVKNFRNLFIVKKNSEVIFAKQHDGNNHFEGGNAWSYDFLQCPKPHAWACGNQDAPYLEMAEEFEYIDGTPGKLDRNKIQQGLWSMEELWGNKDPRFFATIYTMGTPWKGTTVDPHNGLLLPDGTIQMEGSYSGVAALGIQNVGGQYFTSFGVMKLLDENANNMEWISKSSTDYTVFRYGEVLVNLAEAAFELGKPTEAMDAVNQIRTRAGIAKLGSVDREKIRHERKVELAFEGHRYWDLRRWRTAVDVLSVNRSGLRYILDYKTRKYKLQVLENIDGTVAPPKFYPYNYYFPITLSRTGNNPNLVENPGYN